MNTIFLLLGLVLAMLAVEALVFLAHYWQRRFGTMLLGAFAALSVFFISFFAGTVPLARVSPTFSIPVLSLIVYVNILVALLIVYVCDGTKYARRFLAVLIGAYFFAILFQEAIRLAGQTEVFYAIVPLPGRLFEHNWRIWLAAILTLFFAFALVILLYQLLANRRPAWPRGLRLALVLGAVFILDGLFFTTVAFYGEERWLRFIYIQALTKSAATLVLVPPAALYVTRVLREQTLAAGETRPVFDVMHGVTEMDRELQSVLATMIDGLVIYNSDGLVTRCNPGAERLFERSLQGLRLDDPSLRFTLPDGNRLPFADSPLLKALRSKQPVENVELGVRRESGKLRILSVNASPILDSQKRVRGGLATFRDITQRKEIDDSLAEAQDFLKRIIEQAPTGIAVFDRTGAAERFNHVFAQLIGLAASGEGMQTFNLFKDKFYAEGDLLRHFVKAYKGAAVEIPALALDLQTRKPRALEALRFDAPEAAAGAIKVISHFLYPMYDRAGKVDRVVALVTDLTERTRAEQTRRQIAERYQNMVARISDFLFSAKAAEGSLQYEFCTPAVEKVTGYTEQHFLNDKWFWFTIIDADDKQRVQDELGKLIAKRDAQEGMLEYRIRARGGETRWVQARYTFVRDAAGEVERLLGAVTDMTRSKEAEEALRKTVVRFRGLVDSLNDFVLSADLEGKITFANQAFNKVFDSRNRTMIGKDLYRYTHAEDREPIIKRMQELIQSRKPIRGHELRLHKPSGDSLWLRVNVEPLFDDDGEMNSVMITATDVSERKRIDLTLQQQSGALQLLESLARKVAARAPEQEICEMIGSEIPAILGCDAVFIARWEASRQSFMLAAGAEPADLRWARQCCETAAPVLWSDETGVEDERAPKIKALAAVPIMNAQRVLGVLQIDSRREPRLFNSDTVRYLALLARALAEVCGHES
jgi:PAS domain S-box-containing protein